MMLRRTDAVRKLLGSAPGRGECIEVVLWTLVHATDKLLTGI